MKIHHAVAGALHFRAASGKSSMEWSRVTCGRCLAGAPLSVRMAWRAGKHPAPIVTRGRRRRKPEVVAIEDRGFFGHVMDELRFHAEGC